MKADTPRFGSCRFGEPALHGCSTGEFHPSPQTLTTIPMRASQPPTGRTCLEARFSEDDGKIRTDCHVRFDRGRSIPHCNQRAPLEPVKPDTSTSQGSTLKLLLHFQSSRYDVSTPRVATAGESTRVAGCQTLRASCTADSMRAIYQERTMATQATNRPGQHRNPRPSRTNKKGVCKTLPDEHWEGCTNQSSPRGSRTKNECAPVMATVGLE